MMAAQFNLDVAGQLQELLPKFDYIVPSFIIKELENIQKRSRGKTRTAASTALKIAGLKPLKIKNIPLLEHEPVDDALLRISMVLCTNDRELRKKARKSKIPVIYLRQRKYLAVDGYLNV
jgi:rRNA-processing protein FCF1